LETNDTLKYWAACMAAEDLSERTISERLIFFRRLARELGDFRTVTRRELIHWSAEQSWSNRTRVHYRSAMHTFFTWMQDEEFRPDNPAARLPKVRTITREPNPFTIDEINKLINAGMYKKTRAMVALHYYLGLRVSEISRVNGEDVDWHGRTITTIGKGRKVVVLPIPAAAWPLFLDMPRQGYWFPNRVPNKKWGAGEGHILGSSVSNLLSAAIKRAGIKHRPHDLRASTATEMNRGGVTSFVVQKGMRHSNMDTTNKYIRMDVEQIRAGLDHLPALRMPQQSGRRRTDRQTEVFAA
jgi:integrase/recombinase XerD